MFDDPLLRVSRRFQEPPPLPCKVNFGFWHLTTWQNRGVLQHGALLTPDHAPWRDLFLALDEEGASLSSDPVPELDEADAIVATCWLYGSYAYVLTAGELYPPFRVDESLSRISNREMKRINLEFSSGLAAWWSDRNADPDRVNRRCRAALSLLPMAWRSRRKNLALDRWRAVESGERLIAQLRRTLPSIDDASPAQDAESLRKEANWAVDYAYRNGPIESLHAGDWNHGTEIPGFVRLYAAETDEVAWTASERLARHLAVRGHRDGGSLLFAAAKIAGPVDWSLDLETAPVEYFGLPGPPSLDARLKWLANRSPIFAWPSRTSRESS